MKKTFLIVACVAGLSFTTSAFAQNTGPAPQSDNMSKEGMKGGMDKGSMSKEGMSKEGMKNGMMKPDASGQGGSGPGSDQGGTKSGNMK